MKTKLNNIMSCGGLLLAALAFTPDFARADEAPAKEKSALMKFAEQDYMLGTWGGLRTNLSGHGIDFEFFYVGSMPRNVEGGIKVGSVYQGALLMSLDLGSDKLVGYHGGDFHVSALWLHGRDHFSDEHIGDLNKVNLIDFPNKFGLWELYYSQKLFSDKVTVKIGDMSIDRDFIVPEYYNSLASINFVNQTFFYPTLAFNVYDVPTVPKGHHALASTPYAAPGIFLRFDPTEKIYAQAGVYGGNPDRSSSGTGFNLAESEGALAYFETGFKLNASTNDTGLPGSYKIGGYYHTDGFTDAYQGSAAAIAAAVSAPFTMPRSHSGNYGGYFLAEQYLWLEKGKSDPAMQGVVAFFRVAGAPADRNLTQFGVDGGLVFKGLIPTRDWDSFSVGASYLEISHDIRRAVKDANTAYGTTFKLPDYEGAVEISYKAQLTAWWTLQPSIQWVLHPGGRTDLARQPGDAVAFILQSTLRF